MYESAHHHDRRSESTCSRAPARASAATQVNTWPACDSLPALPTETCAYDRTAESRILRCACMRSVCTCHLCVRGAPVKGVVQHTLAASPGVQPKPPSKLRHATRYCTARGTSMACSRSRIEHVSSAQYENLHTLRDEALDEHLSQARHTHKPGRTATSRSTHRVSTSPHSSPENEPSSLCKLATSAHSKLTFAT
jgi:hypothetical protein